MEGILNTDDLNEFVSYSCARRCNKKKKINAKKKNCKIFLFYDTLLSYQTWTFMTKII